MEINAKPKVNYWMFSTLLFALIFFASAGIIAVILNKPINNQSSPIALQPSEIPTSSPVSNLTLEDFPNRKLLGENINYSVYLINSKVVKTPERTGELFVYDKKNRIVIEISGSFSIFGATIVIDDKKGEYVLLSTGTGMSRKIIPLSLSLKTLAGKEFCSISSFLFYKDYVIYGNCDAFQNRPWEAGQAASLVALNLINGQEKTILRSDLMHQYGPTKISGDTLYYLETYVTKEDDWQNPNNHKTISKSYSLLSL